MNGIGVMLCDNGNNCLFFRRLGTSVDKLVEEFEAVWKPECGGYSQKLVEYCSSKTLADLCKNIVEKINDGTLSRITFDMMVAWETPSREDDEAFTVSNCR